MVTGRMGQIMKERTTNEDAARSHRGAPPKPWLGPPTPPLRQEQLVHHARSSRGTLPQRPLTENVGTALRAFYADILTEPLPPPLLQLAEGLRELGVGEGR